MQSIEELLLVVLPRVGAACGANAAAVLLIEEESGDRVVHSWSDQKPDELQQRSVKAEKGLLEKALDSSSVLRLDGEIVPESSRAPQEVLGQSGVALAVALEGAEAPIGAFCSFWSLWASPIF